MASNDGLVLFPGEAHGGRATRRPNGGTVALKAASTDTCAAYSLMELEAPPRAGWLGAHIHHAEEEGIYVLSGQLHVRLGDERLVAPAGTFVLIPRGTVHAHANLDDVPARYLAFFSPPGMEECFAELDALLVMAEPRQPDPAQLAALFQRYHLEAVPSPETEHARGTVYEPDVGPAAPGR